MGYSERYCQLCGVSFCIARIRSSEEPCEAGWNYYGSDHVEASTVCDASTGCENTDAGEHLAGPRCKSDLGYSAYRISLTEIKVCFIQRTNVPSTLADTAQGITQVQCLLWKNPAWVPEEDDEDFELASHCFLTAPSIEAPDEWDSGPLEKVRHGVSECSISNCVETYSVRVCSEALLKYSQRAGQISHIRLGLHSRRWKAIQWNSIPCSML